MSRSTIAQRKSSPCCIGCVIILIIAIGVSLAIGIYMYKFAKNNISLVNVTAKMDPPLDTPPDKLLPPKAGEFARTSLMDTLENVPEWHDMATSSAHVAIYKDPAGHQMTVIAVSTKETRQQRQQGVGLLTMGRSKANSSDVGVTIKDTFSGPGTRMITTWSKPNWTFMVQTSSTLMGKFLDDFQPGGEIATTATVAAETPEADQSLAAPAAEQNAAASVAGASQQAPAETPEVPQGQPTLAAESARADDAVTTQP